MEDAQALLGGDSTYGNGSPSLLLLVFLVLSLALVWNSASLFRQLGAVSAVLCVLVLSFLSLYRASWLVTAAAILLIAIAFTRQALVAYAKLVGLASVLALLAVAAPISHDVISEIGAQVDQRFTDLTGSSGAPQDGMTSSVEERRIEIQDSLADLYDSRPLAYFIGRGSGAEYPTVLYVPDPTTEPGFRHQIHFTWVSVLYRSGAVGLVIVVALVVLANWAAWRGLSRVGRHGHRRVAWAVVAVWVTTSTIGLSTAYGLVGELVWGVMLGILGVLLRYQAAE